MGVDELFVPLIDAIPEEYEVCGPDPDYSVLTPLAAEDELRLVAVETRLLPYDVGDVLEHELKFCIAVLDEETEEVFRIFDRHMAVGYLPDSVRPLVMGCVCRAVEELVRHVQPHVISRVTFTTRPDDKALEKHQMITDTLVTLGLSVQETGTDEFNRTFWRMTKDGDEHGRE